MTKSQKRQNDELRLLRKHRLLRRLLKGWYVYFHHGGKYTGECWIEHKRKIAYVCEWGGDDVPADYIFHELLHVAFSALGQRKCGSKEWRECEEELIQFICLYKGCK